MNSLIEQNRDALVELGRRFGVRRLEIFGSVCTPELDPQRSDIDILVEYPPNYDFGPWLKRFHELRRALTDVLNHPVDLVTTKALDDPWFRPEAAKTRQVIDDASDIAQIA